MSVTALDELATPAGCLMLRRAWPRSPQHVILEYATPGGGLVAGQWLADPDRRRQVATATPGSVVVAGTGVLLQPGGADRRLPGLAGVLGQPGSVLVSHRAERRAVVRRADGCYVKVVRPGRSTAIAAAAGAVATALERIAAVPDLLEHDPERGLLVWSSLPGQTLHQHARSGAAARSWGRAWSDAGSVLRSLHEASLPSSAPARDHADERRAAERWLLAARALGLLPPGREVPLLDPATSAPVTVHGDLHDKQVVINGSGTGPAVGLLDLDGLATGEAAIDLANLLVHLELRTLQGLPVGSATTARSALLDALRPADAVMSRALELADVVRLRLAGLYAFRPASRRVARELHDRVERRTRPDRLTPSGRCG